MPPDQVKTDLSAAAASSPLPVPKVQSEWTLKSIYALTVLTIIYAMNGADRQLLGLMLPLIKQDLQLSDAQLGLATGAAFAVTYSLANIPVARLADRTNRRNILAVGLSVWSFGTLATGAVTSWLQLVLCRMTLGAGESTATAPPASMIGDLFHGRARGVAMSIFAASAPIAGVLLLPALGLVGQLYGWRAAFYAAGGAGILLALLLFTISEPARPSAAAGSAAAQEGLGDTARFLFSSRSYVMVLLGGGMMGISIFSGHAWNAAFLSRVHHLDLVEIGLGMGLAKGVVGTIGTLLGGWLTETLSRRSESWRLIIPALGCLAVFPAEMLFLFAEDVRLCFVGYAVVQFALGIHMGPILTICQYLARERMRATATAGYMLMAFLIGQVIGPFVIGFLNDRWASSYGEGAIRYSLVFVALCSLAGGFCWMLGSRWLHADIQRARLGLADHEPVNQG